MGKNINFKKHRSNENLRGLQDGITQIYIIFSYASLVCRPQYIYLEIPEPK